MPNILEQPEVEHCRDRICLVLSSPSIFGRLVALAALREIRPEDLAGELDAGVVDDLLAQIQTKVFFEWLTLSLQRQTADVANYLASTGLPKRAVLDDQHRSTLIPPQAKRQERDLFTHDMQIVETILRQQGRIGSAAGARAWDSLRKLKWAGKSPFIFR